MPHFLAVKGCNRMSADLQSPQDFLQDLRNRHSHVYPEQKPTKEYLDLHFDQVRQLGVPVSDPATFLDDYFVYLLSLIKCQLPDSIREQVDLHVTVGTIDRTDVNAQIVRSGCKRYFAILVNRSLISMTNHYTKLIATSHYPSSVLYCNGIPAEDRTRSYYMSLLQDLIKTYRDTGIVTGPELKFHLGSEALNFVENAGHAAYLFILAHEIGHFANGDLGRPEQFMSCSWAPQVQVFNQTVGHVIEFKADVFAFEALMKVLRTSQPDFPARRALDMSVTLPFNLLRDISNRGSESHPRPSDRILNVVSGFFGPGAAMVMERSFNDLSQIEAFRNLIGDVTVTDVLAKLAD